MSTSRIDAANLAMVGASPDLTEFLVYLADRPRFWSLRLVAVIVSDGDPDGTVLSRARELGVAVVSTDVRDLQGTPPLGLVIVLSEDVELIRAVKAQVPEGTPRMAGATDEMLTVVSQMARKSHALRADSHRLKETHLRLNQFVETAPLAIYLKDRDLRYKRVNSHALHMLGIREGEILGATDHAIYAKGGARWLQNVERETLNTRETVHASGVLPVQGREIHVQVTLFPVVEDGDVAGLYGLMEDTTDLFVSAQKLHEVDEQLTETQSYLREVLENSRDIILLTDPRGHLLSFNSGAEQSLGYERDDVVGSPAHDLCAQPQAFDDLFAEALLEGHANAYEVEFRNKNTQPVLCNISLTLIESPDGRPLEVVCLCRDITTRLRLKDDLIRSERLAAVGQMASGVAHEINNPLAVIGTIAGLVEEILADEGDRLFPGTHEILDKAMERLHYQVARCQSITHSLLGFVRKTQSGMVEMDLTELLEECLNVLGSEIRGADVKVERHFSTDLPRFRSDPMALQQVFVNLVNNAVDAVQAVPGRASVIEINTARDGDKISVTVEDNGVGIPAGDRERIFDLFHTTKPVGKGTGLGLSIVHDILYRLGGTVRVTSESGEWTRFIVTLPLEPPEEPLPAPSSPSI
ncbi:MAG: PAS domain-containing protein [bacterium]|nr:PAS domain-containing protein [bacterium]